MHERFLPIGVRIIEPDNREAKFSCPGNGSAYISDLEGEMVEAFPVFIEIPVKEVLLVIDDGADHLETSLARQIELNPFEVPCVAEPAPNVCAAQEIDECLGSSDVVDGDRDMIESFDDVLEALMQ